jgi:hypothetical protein
MLDTRCVELDLGWITQRVVDTELLDEATIARTAAVGGDNPVKRCFLAASARETESYGHTRDPGNKSRQILQMLWARVKVGAGSMHLGTSAVNDYRLDYTASTAAMDRGFGAIVITFGRCSVTAGGGSAESVTGALPAPGSAELLARPAPPA